MGSFRKDLNVLHFTLGEMNCHKPKSSPTVSYLFLSNPWLREHIFREDDLKGLWPMLPFDKLNTFTCPNISLPSYFTPPPAPNPAERYFCLFVFLYQKKALKSDKNLIAADDKSYSQIPYIMINSFIRKVNQIISLWILNIELKNSHGHNVFMPNWLIRTKMKCKAKDRNSNPGAMS